ncbi:MAG: hypothetical protein WCE62_00675, partial [Polyangiales bacterium]
LTLFVTFAAACGDPCGDPEDRLVPLSEMPCNKTNADGVWESHPWPPIASEECYWLEFRGCSTYEIEHPLGRVPSVVIGYTGFDADGEYSTNASGNSFVVQSAGDSTITVRNAQNQLFYLKLVLE